MATSNEALKKGNELTTVPDSPVAKEPIRLYGLTMTMHSRTIKALRKLPVDEVEDLLIDMITLPVIEYRKQSN